MNYEEQIKELKEQIAKLEAVLKNEETDKRWKPQEGEVYCFVEGYGGVGYHHWKADDIDNFIYLTHNCFKTQEEAIEHRKEIETYYKYKNFIEERTEPLDWNDNCQKKFSCCYNFYANTIDCDCECGCYKNQGTVYASSEQILKDAIDYIGGEEVAKRYLFGIKE